MPAPVIPMMGATGVAGAGKGAASTIAAIATGLGAATEIGSGIAKMTGDQSTPRPELGGPGTMTGDVAQNLASQFAGKNAVSNNPGLTAPPIAGLDQIQGRMNVIGQRLGINPGSQPLQPNQPRQGGLLPPRTV